MRERERQPISGRAQNAECPRAFCTLGAREVEGDVGQAWQVVW